MPRNRSERAPQTTVLGDVAWRSGPNEPPVEPERPDRFDQLYEPPVEPMEEPEEYMAPKEPTYFDYFRRGFWNAAWDGLGIAFLVFTVISWVWAVAALGWFFISLFAGFSLAGVATPHFFVPVVYSAFWAIGGLIFLVIERGKELG